MSYSGISIREALDKINAHNNGWFLPQVQRQYVWGARHESENYICMLLDSLLKKYPIGAIVLWETEQKVPHREFIDDYSARKFAKQLDEGRWGASKFLVYDGQQRLQTLHSTLRHRFNGRVLYYDLLFDEKLSEADETGFLFREPEVALEARYLRMTELSSLQGNDREKIALERRVLLGVNGDEESELLIRVNISALWNIFVETGHKSIAYFSVKAETPLEVNEVFRRLNTGGVALTQLELILGKIKAAYSDYEERLWKLSETISEHSGGIDFRSTSILQLFHLLIRGTIRVDEDRLDGATIKKFENVMSYAAEPLDELFKSYFNGQLNINNASIVPRWQAVLPMASYLIVLKQRGFEWRIRALSDNSLKAIHQYFLLSQFCDWNTQTMVNAFAREAMAAAESGETFPLEKIRQIAIEKNRTGELYEYQLQSQPWLATKVLMPNRSYVFHEKKPQVDHTFPLSLEGMDDSYREDVDTLWNFQPIPAGVNNYKRARHPKEFFNSEDGSKHWSSYDFIPDPDSPLWDDYHGFISHRKKLMLTELKNLYDLSLTVPQAEDLAED